MRSSSFYKLAFLLAFLTGCETKKETITEIVIQQPPEPVSQPITVNVEASVITGNFLFNSQPALANAYVNAFYSFREPMAGQSTFLGESNDQSYEAMIVNGIYELVYDHVQSFDADVGSGGLPLNEDFVLPPVFFVNGDATQDIDLETVTVRANFTLNNGPFPTSPYAKGIFYLQPVNGGELIEFGHSNRSNDAINIFPGNYHVLWDYVQGDIVPVNRMMRVMENVAITQDTGLDVDVESIAIRVGFTLNGSQFPNSPYESADFYLTFDSGDAIGAEAYLGRTYESGAIINIIPETYNVEYRFIQGGQIIPNNTKALIIEAINVSGPLAIDVQTVTLGVTVTLNGQAFAQSTYEDGRIELYDQNTQSYTQLGRTWNTIEDVIIVAGTYDITYSQEDGVTVPQNQRAVIASAIVASSDLETDIDIQSYNITGNITLDGEAFPFSQYDSANILLRGSNTTDDIQLFISYAQDEAVMVMPGSYDVIYACQTCNNIPFNTDAVIIENFQITEDREINLDLESARIELFKTLNDGAFPASVYASGIIWGGIGDTDRIDMGGTFSSQADIILLTGDYNFWYQVNNVSDNLVPINEWVLVDQQTISN